MSETAQREHELDAEVVSESDAEPGSGAPVRAIEPRRSSAPVIRGEVRTAAIAAAGGVLAGAATVAAVRAVSAVGRGKRSRSGLRRRESGGLPNVIASRSFLIDVHLLDR